MKTYSADWNEARANAIQKLGNIREIVKDAAYAHSNPNDLESPDNEIAEYIRKVSRYIVTVQSELNALQNPYAQD